MAALLCALTVSAHAQNVVKPGLIAELSGPFAQYVQQVLGGIDQVVAALKGMKLSGE